MTTRRDFIKKTVAGTAALSLGSILPGFGSNRYQDILGANEKIRIGVIGVNSRGNALAQGFAKQPDCEVTYICDVDSRALEKCQAAIRKLTGRTPKGEKDIRIKQLEIMFRAKDISVSSADAEALQTFLKITELKKYIPAADRDKLQHWLNIVHQNFATRLNEQYSSLTGREKDICYLTALNLSLETVAQLLDVQPRSIERYTIRICEKFDFRKRSKESFIDFIIAFTHNK